MSGPADSAIAAFKARLAADLVACGFLTQDDDLREEPDALFELVGGETGARRGAGLFYLDTAIHAAFLGGAAPRYLVDVPVRVDAGAANGEEIDRKAALRAALDAITAIATDDSDLGGACERVLIDTAEWQTIEPAGLAVSAVVTLRVESRDPLGRFAA